MARRGTARIRPCRTPSARPIPTRGTDYDIWAAEGTDDTPGTADDDLCLQGPGSSDGASPAIDAGDNAISATDDLGGNTRKQDVGSVTDTGNGSPPIVDMRAYESNGTALPVELASFEGTTHLSDPIAVELCMSEALRLRAPSPNPVRQRATLSFAVKDAEETTLTLYNVRGQKVATLYRGTPLAGEPETVDVSAGALPSGTYFLRLQAGGQTRTERITVVQ